MTIIFNSQYAKAYITDEKGKGGGLIPRQRTLKIAGRVTVVTTLCSRPEACSLWSGVKTTAVTCAGVWWY